MNKYKTNEDEKESDAVITPNKLTVEEFVEKHCHGCGSQRCEGIGTEWFEGCQLRFELNHYSDEINPLLCQLINRACEDCAFSDMSS